MTRDGLQLAKFISMPSRAYRLDRDVRGKSIIDNRKGDRHKQPRVRKKSTKTYKPKSKWERRRIVAWDGEGYTLEDGVTHVYNLLANSHNHYIMDHTGLDTEKIFAFLLHESDPKAINVIYGGSYDVNMFLKDIPLQTLATLWTSGTCYWRNYKIQYAHRKKFSIREQLSTGKGRSFVLWDVLGYFQASFVDACKKWMGDMPIFDEIQKMKLQRSTFTEAQFSEVVSYNRTECYLLVELVTNLFNAMDEAGITLRRYDGAGSIASYLLMVNDVKSHKGVIPIGVQHWAACAYSGGRIEAPKVGNLEDGRVFRYDINSAYPSSCITLPSFRESTWVDTVRWFGNPYSLVKVRWCWKEAPFYPLWYREANGSILYPREGTGIFWGVELIGLPQDQYQVIECTTPTLPDKTKPFEFIQDVYETRLMFKQRGSMASEALKLGMNSIYGKLAQQAGWKEEKRDSIPTYHNLAWAGLITAMTRKRMYEAAMQQPDKVIAFATDAVISTVPLDLELGEGLGKWTADIFDGITIVQPGVYWLRKGNEWQAKYRGFDKGSLSRYLIAGTWYDWDRGMACILCSSEQECDHIHAKLTRFIGLGGALMSTEFYKHWTHWEAMERRLTIIPSGKRRGTDDTSYYEKLCDTVAVEPVDAEVLSLPYPIAWLGGSPISRPTENGIDVRIIEEEEIDSYA